MRESRPDPWPSWGVPRSRPPKSPGASGNSSPPPDIGPVSTEEDSMAFVHTVPVDRASGDVHAMYSRIEAAVGYVPNYAKLFSHRPQVMATWSAFLASIRGNMDPRRYELVTLAAARALQCSYCMLAHGAVLRRDFYSAEELTEITRDPAMSDLSPAEAAMMVFVDKLTRDATAITPADVQ